MLFRKITALFSVSQKLAVKQYLNRINIILVRIFAFSPLSSSLYYSLFSASFRREQHAVLRGHLAYQLSLQQLEQSSILLRRNIHRLEKGLIMQPRRLIFAEDYILETVQDFAAKVTKLELAELKWALAVLTEYFEVVGSKPLIDKARKIFESVSQFAEQRLEHQALPPSVPYTYAELPQSNIDYASLLMLFQRRRSVRWFLNDAVPANLLQDAIKAASYAPSACNRQPFHFIQLNDPTTASEVADFAMGTSGFSANIPRLLVVVGDLSAYPNARDRHVIYIDAALASMQLMLALDTLGLASCPINWPDIESREKKMVKRLKLQPYQRPIMLIAFGYADPQGGIAYSQKKSVDLLLQADPEQAAATTH